MTGSRTRNLKQCECNKECANFHEEANKNLKQLQETVDLLMEEVKVLKESNIELIRLLTKDKVCFVNKRNIADGGIGNTADTLNVSFNSTTSTDTVIDKNIEKSVNKKLSQKNNVNKQNKNKQIVVGENTDSK